MRSMTSDRTRRGTEGGHSMTDTTEKTTGFRFRDLGKMFGGSRASRQFGILGALVIIIVFFQSRPAARRSRRRT